MQRLALSLCIGLVGIACSKNKDTSTVDPDATATTISPTTDPDAPGMYDKQEDEKPKDQRTLQTEACEGGKGDICTSVGVMWEQGKEGPADAAKAREFYEKGCALGHKIGCTYYAAMLDAGVGGPADPKAARELHLNKDRLRICDRKSR